MIDEQNEVRRINWNEVFAFTHIFKGFKMAIQPSKMMLALAAIILVYLFGAVVLDGVWSLSDSRVMRNEIGSHVVLRGPEFTAAVERWRERRVNEAAALRNEMAQERRTLANYANRAGIESKYFRAAFGELLDKEDKGADPPTIQALLESKKSWSELLGEASQDLATAVAKAEGLIKRAYDEVEGRMGKDETLKEEKDKQKARQTAREDRGRASRALTVTRVAFDRRVQAIKGQPVFAAFLDYERDCILNAIRAVRYGNFTGGLADYRQMLINRGVPTQNDMAAGAEQAQDLDNLQAVPGNVVPANERCGLLYWKLMALHGLLWMVQEHWIYAALLGLFTLAVWALFGGAIYRIAALHAAREEKISASQAVKFASSKFFSFFCAPLVPALIILGIGLIMSLVALLLGNIPAVGSILIGLPFIAALLGGMVIAFVTVGLAGGGALMYPTIAVEGSDSFDAISRSFSYIYARPWRAILYAVIAAFYGVITFLFVRLFAWIALAATHCFVKLGIVTGGDALAANADKIDVLWPAPTLERLVSQPNWQAIGNFGDKLGAFCIWLWVGLIALGTLAYLVSFCASSSTIIYYLLRRKVDATDLDDVYVEETEEPAGGVSDQPAPAAPSGEPTPPPPPAPPAVEPPKPEGDKPA